MLPLEFCPLKVRARHRPLLRAASCPLSLSLSLHREREVGASAAARPPAVCHQCFIRRSAGPFIGVIARPQRAPPPLHPSKHYLLAWVLARACIFYNRAPSTNTLGWKLAAGLGCLASDFVHSASSVIYVNQRRSVDLLVVPPPRHTQTVAPSLNLGQDTRGFMNPCAGCAFIT